MSAVAFDTLAAAKRLMNAGLERKTAEAIVETFGSQMTEHLATKDDLRATEWRIKRDITGIVVAVMSVFFILDKFFGG